MIKVFILYFISMLCFQVGAQPLESKDSSYVLIPPERNELYNETHLDSFFERLYQLKTSGEGQVNIVHIGDSHIQADFLTEVIRKKMQDNFGNAGRGLIVAGKVAGTNEPLNIRTSSSSVWLAKRCVYIKQPLPIGIGGITLHTSEPGAKINIRMNDVSCDYRFNALTVFYQKDQRGFNLSIQDSSSVELGLIDPLIRDSDINFSKVRLPGLYNSISIQTVKSTEDQQATTLFGVNLENGKSGVLYHAIGVNGAKYLHYNAAQYFAQQTTVLQPDLFIISLGTNESVEYPYLDKNFYQHVSKLVESLAEFNPGASFILVSPPDAFQKKIKPNPGIENIRNQIIQYAVENGLGFWDMYKVSGGKDSAVDWRLQGLLRPDGIHFTKEGYKYQGNLLYEAIMKRYNQYVSSRYP